MHEVSIAQEIIEIVKSNLTLNDNATIKFVRVEIGDFSNINCESLKFGYEVLTQGTNLQNSWLLIDNIPLTIKCHDCGRESILDEPLFFCSYCGGSKVEIIRGTEMKVKEIELIDEEVKHESYNS